MIEFNLNCQFVNTTFSFIEYMLLLNKIILSDVPFELRTAHESIYIVAFRIDRSISKERYIGDLHLLAQDITKVPESERDELLDLYKTKLDYFKNYM